MALIIISRRVFISFQVTAVGCPIYLAAHLALCLSDSLFTNAHPYDDAYDDGGDPFSPHGVMSVHESLIVLAKPLKVF